MKQLIGVVVLLLLVVAPATAQDNVLTLITHDSFNISEDVQAAFEAETGITLEILPGGDAGQMVNQSILSKGNPLADVMFGIDNTFLSRGLENELFVPYESPMLENVPEDFVLDEEHRVTPIDYGDVCLNYDVAYFEENELAVPQSLTDLTDPAYEGLLVVENPATSSPGLAFLLTTIGVFGTEGDYTYLDYWTDLVENEVRVVDGWETAYYGEFSGASGGEGTYPLVVSYASSPPVEVYFMETPPETAPTASVVAPQTCFRQIEFAGILAGTDKVEEAQQLIDFMLGVEFQEDVPLQMFVFPVNQEAELPQIFLDHAQVVEEPVVIDAAELEANRADWIQAWTDTVLR
ncbi:MAG: thiamine ABC transporter substrate-binding protein [Anaerolineaceae bacterium]|nr:thiamine ABC transporter substrate-binding protein [Anaerolineaceae bacterium]